MGKDRRALTDAGRALWFLWRYHARNELDEPIELSERDFILNVIQAEPIGTGNCFNCGRHSDWLHRGMFCVSCTRGTYIPHLLK